jgi:hypothetical protein
MNKEKLSDGSLTIIMNLFIIEANDVLTKMLSHPII